MSRSSAPSPPPVEPGDILADRYQVVDIIGEGGMGIVFECMHLKLGKRVAVKMLLEDAAEDEEIRIRFDREARAAAQLKSQYVAHVLDVDETADGRPFMVMEFLEGYGLDEVVEGARDVDVTEAVDYILQACSGMAEAHALGIVHRDLKPPNLFCSITDGEARVKVIDFGISKVLLPGEQKGVTQTTTTFGTPLYMSPEQIQSAKNVDSRADVWSLGVILYELLVGCPPFDGDNPGAVIWSICSTQPTPPIEERDDLPQGLSDVIMVALEKDREDRFQSVVQLAEALEDFGTAGVFEPPPESADIIRRSHRSGRGMMMPVTSAPSMRQVERSDRVATHAPWTTSRRFAIRRTRNALVVSAVALLGLIGGGVVVVTMQGHDVAPAADSRPPAHSPPATGKGPLPQPASSSVNTASPPPGLEAPSARPTATPSASSSSSGSEPHAPPPRTPRPVTAAPSLTAPPSPTPSAILPPPPPPSPAPPPPATANPVLL